MQLNNSEIVSVEFWKFGIFNFYISIPGLWKITKFTVVFKFSTIMNKIKSRKSKKLKKNIFLHKDLNYDFAGSLVPWDICSQWL